MPRQLRVTRTSKIFFHPQFLLSEEEGWRTFSDDEGSPLSFVQSPTWAERFIEQDSDEHRATVLNEYCEAMARKTQESAVLTADSMESAPLNGNRPFSLLKN